MNPIEQTQAGPSKSQSSTSKRARRRRQRKEGDDAETLALILQDISLVKEMQATEGEKPNFKRHRAKTKGRQQQKMTKTESTESQGGNKRSKAPRGQPKKSVAIKDEEHVEGEEEPTSSLVEVVEEKVVVEMDEISTELKVPDLVATDSGETTENDQHDIRDYVLGMTSVGQSFLGINLATGGDSSTGGPDGGGPEFEPIELPKPTRRRKGAYGLPPQVSDEELNEKIQASWKKDRMAKASRKKERENLRRQGLLQAKKENMIDELYDIRPNYPAGGMKLADLKRELETFCLSLPNLHLALPPVNPAARRAIHTIVHKLSLKSKSHGKEEERYIIISKPDGQHEWNEKVFDRVASSLKVRFYLTSKSATKDSTKDDWENIGFGDEVSWNTPAVMKPTTGTIKAKAWMQKMGWSEGQGLGSSENKGIVDPIQVFKKSNRGGLGWDS